MWLLRGICSKLRESSEKHGAFAFHFLPFTVSSSLSRTHTHANAHLGDSDNVLWWYQIGRVTADKYSWPCLYTPLSHLFCKHTSVLQTQTHTHVHKCPRVHGNFHLAPIFNHYAAFLSWIWWIVFQLMLLKNCWYSTVCRADLTIYSLFSLFCVFLLHCCIYPPSLK